MGSSFLYAEPSFWEGAARLFDFGGTMLEFNRCVAPEQADFFALRADWRAVGDDIRRAHRLFEKQQKQR